MAKKLDVLVIRNRSKIVKETRTLDKGIFTEPFGYGTEPDDIYTESDSMAYDKMEETRRDKTVFKVVPQLPFTLIEAVETNTPYETGKASWGIEEIGALELDETAGAGVTVAVLDSGINITHPAFFGMELVQENFTQDRPDDRNGHGTHCAGTIFGRDVDGVRIGVARGVKRALIGKVLGRNGGSTQSIFRALMWAAKENADIISLSLGMDFPSYRETLISKGHAEKEATSLALSGYRENIRLFDDLGRAFSGTSQWFRKPLMVAAAGNESRRPRYTISAAPPASALGFLSVAAVTESLEPAWFSNTDAMISGPGENIVSADHTGGLIGMSGTSMAAPHIVGLAAALADKLTKANEACNPERLTFELKRAARKLKHPDEAVGIGLAQWTLE